MVLQYGLLRSDFELIKYTLPHITRVIPVRDSKYQVRHNDKQTTCRVVGCTEDYLDVTHLKLSQGRFINKDDGKLMANVAVIASETANKLFPSEDPVGNTIRVEMTIYEIIGVTQKRGSSAAIGGSLSAQNYDLDVYIPIETFRGRNGDMIVKRETGSLQCRVC